VPKAIFTSTEREKAHAELERVLKKGDHPRAECREYHNQPEPYQVWDEPEPWVQTPPTPKPAAEPDISDALLDKLAAKLLEKMSEKK